MGEKTEAPTPRHLEEMRRKGDIAQSAELTASLTLLLAVYMLGSRMGALASGLQEVMRRSFMNLTRTELTLTSLQDGTAAILQTVGPPWLSFFLSLAGAGIVVGLAQTRGVVAVERLRPSFDRLNPIAGAKRIFSQRGLFETAKGLLKMALLGLILYRTLWNLPMKLVGASQTQLGAGIALLGDALSTMARQGAVLLVVAAGIDYIYQFRQHRQRMKMSREEVQEDMKGAEGQPMIKAKIRGLQRRWSRQRMMQQLAHADVVVTNPTHLAIALQYDRQTMLAPSVVAKGKGLIAEQIMLRSRELGIPLVQNIPLAHALIHVEIDAQIPVTLYQAVAEVLAFVYRLRKQGSVATYAGPQSLRSDTL